MASRILMHILATIGCVRMPLYRIEDVIKGRNLAGLNASNFSNTIKIYTLPGCMPTVAFEQTI